MLTFYRWFYSCYRNVFVIPCEMKKLYSGANDERNIEKHEQEKNSNNLFVRRVLKWKSSTRHVLGRRRTRLFFWSPQFFGEAIRVRNDLLHPPKFEDLYLQESLNFCKNVVKTFSFGALTFDKKKHMAQVEKE